jgi:hypothetical protein
MLKHLRARLDYYLQVLLDIRSYLDECRRVASITGNKTAENHVARIGLNVGLDPSELSYSFLSVCRRLNLELPKTMAASRTILCTIAVGESYIKLVEPCLKSQAAYAGRHGFDYVQLGMIPGDRNRSPHWYKIALAYKLFQAGYANVMFIDADAIITNPAIDAASFCAALAKEEKAFYAAEDLNGVNTGVFFVRNCPDAARLLDLIWQHDLGGHSEREQDALVYLMDRYPQVRGLVKIADAGNLFNSFPSEGETGLECRRYQPNTWKPGDFVCHFAGLRGPELQRMIAEYGRRISS